MRSGVGALMSAAESCEQAALTRALTMDTYFPSLFATRMQGAKPGRQCHGSATLGTSGRYGESGQRGCVRRARAQAAAGSRGHRAHVGRKRVKKGEARAGEPQKA